MHEDNHIFLKNGNRIFLTEGLDRPNQLESTREIRFLAHAILRFFTRRARRDQENRTDLPLRCRRLQCIKSAGH